MDGVNMSNPILTEAAVAVRAARIATLTTDPEMAHSEEDDLRRDVLAAIAENRCADPVACAQGALLSEKLDFPRWCA
jgi:hypothetical protein